MRMFDSLELKDKLEMLSQMTENIKKSIEEPKPPVDKMALLEELCGSWADMDDKVIQEIYGRRTISDREINLD